jgi:hypothetical protein
MVIGAFHCGQPARVLASEGFSARPKKRDEKVFANERTEMDG